MNNPWWYVLFNVMVWVVCFLITRKYANNYYKARGEVKRQAASVFVVYVIVLIGSLFIFYGGDNARYSDMVNNFQDELGSYENGKMTLELIYIQLAEICAGNYMLWKLIVYGFGLFLAYLTCKRFKCNDMMFLYAFTLIVLHSYGAARVYVAVAVFLFGLSLLDKAKIIQSLIGISVCLLSVVFHSSMILPIVLLPSIFIKITKKRFIILLLAIPLFVAWINTLPGYLLGNDDFMGTVSGYKMETYTASGTNQGGGSSILVNLSRITGYLMIISMVFYSIIADNKKALSSAGSAVTRVSFFVIYFAIVFLFTEIGSNGTLFYRYFDMTYALVYVMFPILLTRPLTFKKHSRQNLEIIAFSFNAINIFMLVYYAFLG